MLTAHNWYLFNSIGASYVLVTRLYFGHRMDQLCQASQFNSEEVFCMWSIHHSHRSVINVIWFLAVFCSRFWAAFAVSTGGFNQPAAICICDVMLLESLFLSVQFQPIQTSCSLLQLTHVLRPVSVDRNYIM